MFQPLQGHFQVYNDLGEAKTLFIVIANFLLKNIHQRNICMALSCDPTKWEFNFPSGWHDI